MPFARVCWAAGIHDHNPVPVSDYLFVSVTVQYYVYWFFELYEDDAALGGHGQGDGMKAAMAALGALLTAPPTINIASPVAAKGINL